MQGSVSSGDSDFDRTVEELRIEAFRVYEAIRAIQRGGTECDSGLALSVAGSLAADLSEHAMLASGEIRSLRAESLRVSSGRHVGRIKVARAAGP